MAIYDIYRDNILIEMNVELSDEERNHKIRHEEVFCKLVEKKSREYKMYVLVAYNLSDIQKGIQCAHAIAEYAQIAYRCSTIGDKIIYDRYIDWVNYSKTIIILNGGTTSSIGTLQKYKNDLIKMGVFVVGFNEPDLNNAETAVAFLVDVEKDTHILQYLSSMKLA